jgi:hypothetical protein
MRICDICLLRCVRYWEVQSVLGDSAQGNVWWTWKVRSLGLIIPSSVSNLPFYGRPRTLMIGTTPRYAPSLTVISHFLLTLATHPQGLKGIPQSSACVALMPTSCYRWLDPTRPEGASVSQHLRLMGKLVSPKPAQSPHGWFIVVLLAWLKPPQAENLPRPFAGLSGGRDLIFDVRGCGSVSSQVRADKHPTGCMYWKSTTKSRRSNCFQGTMPCAFSEH